MTRRQAVLGITGSIAAFAAPDKTGRAAGVRLLRVPNGGLQPQAAFDARGVCHLLYYSGDTKNGDVFYVKSVDGGVAFSAPLRVNSQPGSAIARGSIRGAQLALGAQGRVHVAWNGSASAPPGPVNPDDGKPGSPMLYARLNDSATAFEPQRNLMHSSFGLDGGGSVAADRAGNVYVAWHGIGLSEAKGELQGEARRQVWLVRSVNEGRTFSPDAKAWTRPTGACGCCGMKLFVTRKGDVLALYRSATESVHRDIYLIRSTDQGRTFQGARIHKWDINACPMSSMDFAESDSGIACAWETAGQVYWLRLDPDGHPAGEPVAAPGEGKGRKHPRVAIQPSGDLLLAWNEGAGHESPGTLAWQVFGRNAEPLHEGREIGGIPALSFAAALPGRDGSFTILY